jgi:hypothetical protein
MSAPVEEVVPRAVVAHFCDESRFLQTHGEFQLLHCAEDVFDSFYRAMEHSMVEELVSIEFGRAFLKIDFGF